MKTGGRRVKGGRKKGQQQGRIKLYEAIRLNSRGIYEKSRGGTELGLPGDGTHS